MVNDCYSSLTPFLLDGVSIEMCIHSSPLVGGEVYENEVKYGAWHTLLCKLRHDKNFDRTRISSATNEIRIRICQIFDFENYRHHSSELNYRADSLRKLQFTEWEEWLDEKNRFSAGIAYAIHPVEAAITFFEVVFTDHYVHTKLLEMSSAFSESEQSLVDEWICQNAEELE